MGEGIRYEDGQECRGRGVCNGAQGPGEGSRSPTRGLLWVQLVMCHGRADSLTLPQGFADA